MWWTYVQNVNQKMDIWWLCWNWDYVSLLKIFLNILECIWWPLQLCFLFMGKRWLKIIIYDIKIIYLCTRYGNNISNHPKNIWLETANLIRKRLLWGIHCNQKIGIAKSYLVWLKASQGSQIPCLCFFSNWAVALSKFYCRRTSEKAIVYIKFPWHNNIMTDAGLFFLYMYCQLCPLGIQEERVALFFLRGQHNIHIFDYTKFTEDSNWNKRKCIIAK